MLSKPRFESYEADMPLWRLRTAEVFVVTSLRLWNTGDFDAATEEPQWRLAFRRARIELRGALAFDQFCRMLVIAATRSIQVRTRGCCALSRDEALLLHVLSQLQVGRPWYAAAALAQFCTPLAARLTLTPGHTLAVTLAARGLWLPERGVSSHRDESQEDLQSSLTEPARVH